MSQKVIFVSFGENTARMVSDEKGRFNLNVLHELSRSGKNKQPSNWLRSKRAKDLVTLNSVPHIRGAVIVRGGDAQLQGTFAVEPVLYAYAEWISAEFHQVVITAFTALANNNVKKAKEIVRSYAAHCCPC